MKRITLISTFSLLWLICLLIVIFPGRGCRECFSPPVMAVKFFLCGLLIIISTIYFTKEFQKFEKIIFDIESLPLLETDEAVDGVPFVGEGIVEPEGEEILRSPYTKTPCVYFHSIKEKYVKEGKNEYWKIVENLVHFIPFYIKDERGKLKIDLTNLDKDFSGYEIPSKKEDVPNPKNSEIDCEPLLIHQPWHPEDEKWFFFFFPEEKYRISEFVLRPGTKVFVHGMVSRKNGQLVLCEAENHPLVISKKNRDQYVRDFYRGSNLTYMSHFFLAIGFTFTLLSINYFLKINPTKLLISLFLGNSIILGTSLFSLYNRIITLKHRALNALSNIDVELKRRDDLISNIIEAVKSYIKHESELQKIVAEGRAKLVFSKDLKEERKPVIGALVATIERYPNLKASENFQKLMRILIDTEERIAYSREFYNRTTRKYNTVIKQIPFLFISLLLKLKEMDFVSIARGEAIKPEVSI